MNRKKNKGFTLIELLAVIVVLAIIALIATPIVMKTINNARVGAAERSADNYIKAIETVIMEEKLNGNQIEDGKYEIKDGNICLDKDCLEKIEIEMSGTKPSSGSIVIKNGSVTKESSMTIGDYTIVNSEDKYKALDLKNNICSIVSGEELAIGSKYMCELGDNDIKIFYVLEENGDNISLIMNMNIDSNGKGTISGNTVAWCKSGNDNSCAADGALEYLKNSTTNWTKLSESRISMPSAEQIASASGKTFNGSVISGLSTWLYENLNVSGSPSAYWTSTPNASLSGYAWSVGVGYDGDLYDGYVDSGSYRGVRPVITISKSNLA